MQHHIIPVNGGGIGRGKVTGFIIFQFSLIAIAALLAFHLANEFGVHPQYIEVTSGDTTEWVEGLRAFWQYYALVAVGFLILIAGGYATLKLDTKRTSIAVSHDGSVIGQAVGKSYPWFGNGVKDFALTKEQIASVNVRGKGGVLIIAAADHKYKVYLSQKNGEEIKEAIGQ
ncbi:MAG: hypothetical protein FWE06_07290 [Oscillospiraceae bacterium]|nr:hypothetical protein [Oscillospiraceae bacterium]